MFGMGSQELLLILVIVLVLFGGSKLPDLAKSLGKSMKEFPGEIAREVHEGVQERDGGGTRGGADTQPPTRRSREPGAASVRVLQESP